MLPAGERTDPIDDVCLPGRVRRDLQPPLNRLPQLSYRGPDCAERATWRALAQTFHKNAFEGAFEDFGTLRA